ncbi:MAG: DUF4335 domain-containing protein [Leptolyngbyaceae cyanobacterium SL_7_1]|nr:DUF4335 domain-containing protein [Leptolyngbyaceae cyanobacterium SL_7_1]
MTIQRQYSLPNCTLILEGLGDAIAITDTTTVGRPPLSVLLNVECRFTGQTPSLTGGREFLEQLIAIVSRYAQECLSGISHTDLRGKVGMVHLEHVDPDVHRLTVYPKSDQPVDAGTSSEPIQLNLKTLQLFDLVEAIDQLLADTQTLPDLTADLTPVSRRAIAAQEPVVTRAAPLALGVSSLAAAALALFFVPLPDVRPPEPEPTTQESPASPAAGDTASPEPVSPDQAATLAESPAAETESENGSTSAETTTEREPSVDAAETELETLLAAPPIADAAQIDQLTEDLRNQLSDEWDRDHTFDEDLVYRVGVAENGDILGFKQTDQASIDYTDETPLLDLLYLPIEDRSPRQEAIAQFRVVFTPSGVVEVSPWYGRLLESGEESVEESGEAE